MTQERLPSRGTARRSPESVQGPGAISKYIEDNGRQVSHCRRKDHKHGKGKNYDMCFVCWTGVTGLGVNIEIWKYICSYMCTYTCKTVCAYMFVYSLALSSKRACSDEPPGVQTLVSKYNSPPKGLLAEIAASRSGAQTRK